MHPIFHLFSVSDALHYRGAGKKSSRAYGLLPKRLLRIPGCFHPVSMRVTPELFELAEATPGWHLLVVPRLHQHIALIRGPELAQRWLQDLTESQEAGLVSGAPVAQEVSHG
jgi:hypothetical protein